MQFTETPNKRFGERTGTWSSRFDLLARSSSVKYFLLAPADSPGVRRSIEILDYQYSFTLIPVLSPGPLRV